MNIRTYRQDDWRPLHQLYNRCLHGDRVSPEFFMEHLIMDPNFDPAGVTIMEDNHGTFQGAAVAQVLKHNPSPWTDHVASSRETGYLMPLLIDRAPLGAPLLQAAEDYFRAEGRKSLHCVALGPTLFPDGVDQELYPVICQALEAGGYQVANRHYSMRCNLHDFKVTDDVEQKRNALAAQGITARICTLADLPALRAFLEDGDLRGRMQNISHKLRAHELDEMVVIGTETTIYGYCQYHYFDAPNRVGPFGIASALRGQGLGQVMVAKLLEVMAERGFLDAYFASCSSSNRNFYAKNGFEVYRTKRIYTKEL